MTQEDIDEALEDERNERRYALQDHNRKSSAPLPRDGKVPRYHCFYDEDDNIACDIVWVDLVTGEKVMRYDAGDPANTDPAYGATPDGVIFKKKGRDIKELIDPAERKFTAAELQQKWSQY